MAEGTVIHGSHYDHGSSVAAWTGVLVLLVGSALIALGVYINVDILTIIGTVVCVLGIVGAMVLAKAGFGVEAKRRQMAESRSSEARTGLRRG